MAVNGRLFGLAKKKLLSLCCQPGAVGSRAISNHDLSQRPPGDIRTFVFFWRAGEIGHSQPFKVPGETPPVSKLHAIVDHKTLWFDNVLSKDIVETQRFLVSKGVRLRKGGGVSPGSLNGCEWPILPAHQKNQKSLCRQPGAVRGRVIESIS